MIFKLHIDNGADHLGDFTFCISHYSISGF
jgi:hypothetical protein